MKALYRWVLSWLIPVSPFYFTCPHCGMIAESDESDDIIEWGTLLVCSECGKDTVIVLVKDSSDLMRHV